MEKKQNKEEWTTKKKNQVELQQHIEQQRRSIGNGNTKD